MTATEKLPPPEGTRAMMISMREMDTMGLKTGSGLRETVPSRTFSKAQVLQEIAQVGFMCPFHEFRADIAVRIVCLLRCGAARLAMCKC